MFGLEAGFIWRGGRKYCKICYWHLIPDISVDCKTNFFLYFSLFLSFFLLYSWIYVKWTEVIIHIWQGSWKHCILFLMLLTVINPSPLVPLIRVRSFFLCRCLKCEIRCFPQSCTSDLHHSSNPTKRACPPHYSSLGKFLPASGPCFVILICLKKGKKKRGEEEKNGSWEDNWAVKATKRIWTKPEMNYCFNKLWFFYKTFRRAVFMHRVILQRFFSATIR